MRGEYVHPIVCALLPLGSPPHARGILCRCRGCLDRFGITPACAGNTSSNYPLRGLLRDHPRMRGEYLNHNAHNCHIKGSPPHARGIPAEIQPPERMTGITPACAGNTSFISLKSSSNRDHPRMRGEYIDNRTNEICIRGSPPHARGILYLSFSGTLSRGITPACAGNTPATAPQQKPSRDHPRMRGEYSAIKRMPEEDQGSPPHARGIH